MLYLLFGVLAIFIILKYVGLATGFIQRVPIQYSKQQRLTYAVGIAIPFIFIQSYFVLLGIILGAIFYFKKQYYKLEFGKS